MYKNIWVLLDLSLVLQYTSIMIFIMKFYIIITIGPVVWETT
jgi:hypothetical protein